MSSLRKNLKCIDLCCSSKRNNEIIEPFKFEKNLTPSDNLTFDYLENGQKIAYNDNYIELCRIIGNTSYFKNGIDIGNSEFEKNWYIADNIKFKAKLDDKIIIWKHLENNKWDQKTITVKEILQINGT